MNKIKPFLKTTNSQKPLKINSKLSIYLNELIKLFEISENNIENFIKNDPFHFLKEIPIRKVKDINEIYMSTSMGNVNDFEYQFVYNPHAKKEIEILIKLSYFQNLCFDLSLSQGDSQSIRDRNSGFSSQIYNNTHINNHNHNNINTNNNNNSNNSNILTYKKEPVFNSSLFLNKNKQNTQNTQNTLKNESEKTEKTEKPEKTNTNEYIFKREIVNYLLKLFKTNDQYKKIIFDFLKNFGKSNLALLKTIYNIYYPSEVNRLKEICRNDEKNKAILSLISGVESSKLSLFASIGTYNIKYNHSYDTLNDHYRRILSQNEYNIIKIIYHIEEVLYFNDYNDLILTNIFNLIYNKTIISYSKEQETDLTDTNFVPNTSEIQRKIVVFLKNKYKNQFSFMEEVKFDKYTVDLYIKDLNLVVECNGLTHFYPFMTMFRQSDKVRYHYLKRRFNLDIVSIPFYEYENQDTEGHMKNYIDNKFDFIGKEKSEFDFDLLNAKAFQYEYL